LLEIDSIRVKGKTEAEVIYTIVGRADVADTREFKSLQDHWANLLLCYRKQDWSGAPETIKLCRRDCERFGLIGLIDAYADRIRRLEQVSPAPDWDGVFTAETK
jgi:adenylate cyclase